MDEENSVPMNKILLIFILLFGITGLAQKIDFPQDELPSESVEPVLDSPKAVFNKRQTFAKKFEVGFVPGWNLSEPFFSNLYLGFSAVYNTSEENGFGLKYQKWNPGYSTYASQFTLLDFGRAPAPSQLMSLSYEHRPLYGKVSLGKETVTPFLLYFAFDLGYLDYLTRKLPSFGLGLGQKIYFSRNVGFGFGLNLRMQQVVDTLSANLRTATGTVPTAADFNTKVQVGMDLDFKLLWLF